MRAVMGCMLVLGALACGSAGGPQTFMDTDKTAMRASLDSFTAYVVMHRDSMAAAMYADNAAFMPPNQMMLQGRTAIRAWIKQTPPLSHFTAAAIEINGRGDLAYIRGTFQAEFASGQTDHGKFLEVRRREKAGRWLIVADIFNSDLPPPTTPPHR